MLSCSENMEGHPFDGAPYIRVERLEGKSFRPWAHKSQRINAPCLKNAGGFFHWCCRATWSFTIKSSLHYERIDCASLAFVWNTDER